jgi:hypothetical protein
MREPFEPFDGPIPSHVQTGILKLALMGEGPPLNTMKIPFETALLAAQNRYSAELL